MVKRRDLLKLAAMSVVAGPAPAFAAMARNGKTDVVVIGSGGAGFSAAITAHDLGAKVIVFEKMPIIGGNTQIASGGMNAAGTRYQEAAGVKDTWKLMYDDTMKGGYNRGIPALVEVFAKNSADFACLACQPRRRLIDCRTHRRRQRRPIAWAEKWRPGRPPDHRRVAQRHRQAKDRRAHAL